jgi:hypothetical protein
MGTRNIVPRENNEGNIGTSVKKWLKGWFASVFVNGNITDGVNNVTVAELRNQLDNPSTPDADQIATTDSGETVQSKIDDADAHAVNTSNPHSVTPAQVATAHTDLTDMPSASNSDHDERYTSRSLVNGSFKETFNSLASSDGATVLADLEQSGGGDLTMQFSDGDTILDTTPSPITIELTAGTDTNPQSNYIYIPQSTKILTKSISGFPTDTEHIKVAYFLVPSAPYVAADGVYINQNWNDHLIGGDNQGHLSHMSERQRRMGASYFSGLDPAGTDDSVATSYFDYVGASESYFKCSSGVIYQLHTHPVLATDSRTDIIHVINWNGNSYNDINNLADIISDSEGVSLGNKYFNLFFFEVGNKTGAYSPIMCMLPSGSYNSEISALNDSSGYGNLNMPREFGLESSTGIPICKLTLKWSGGTTTLTHISTVDLRQGAGLSGGDGGVTDHGALTGLADDDHSQYHNDSRGDTRYLYKENTTPFTPDADHEPSTKKYTDDTVSTHATNTSNPHSVTKTQVGLTNVDDVQQMPLSYLDTDPALAADSDTKVASQKAGKAYINALLEANDAMVYKGVIDCGGNPDYPAAEAGHTYRISVAGKLGGASGENVEVGDMAICVADSTASGDQAAVGEFWNIIQVNIDGNVVALSPFISVDDNIPKYSGTSGRILEDSGVAISDVTGHIADTANPHSVVADQVGTDDSGVTVQSALDAVESDVVDLKESVLTFVIDGGGSEISTGVKGDLLVPFGCTITKVTLLADQTGSVVIDIWKDTYANFDPTVADSITASAKPTITTAKKSQDATLTGWTTAITAEDILRFNVDSITDIQRVSIILSITRN